MSYIHYDSDNTEGAVYALTRGDYQLSLAAGIESWSGSTLTGAAKKWGGKYAASRASLLAKINAAGFVITELKGERGRRELLICQSVSVRIAGTVVACTPYLDRGILSWSTGHDLKAVAVANGRWTAVLGDIVLFDAKFRPRQFKTAAGALSAAVKLTMPGKRRREVADLTNAEAAALTGLAA